MANTWANFDPFGGVQGVDSGTMPSAYSVAQRQALAKSIMEGQTPAKNLLGVLANTLGGSISGYENRQATDEAKLGQTNAAKQLADILAQPTPDKAALGGLIGNDFANPGQQQVASALLGQSMAANDPSAQLDMKYKQAQIDALGAKATPERKILNDASGVPRYVDDGSAVYPTEDAAGGATPPFNGDQFKGESSLRGEYNGLNTVKDFGLQTQAYQRVLDSAKDASPAGDLALIFNFMKVLDPGSTVREGEFATAQNSGSVPEQLWAQYNKIMTGERLAPEIRKDFVNRAGSLYQGAAGIEGSINDRYSGLAGKYGFEPDNIINKIPTIGVLDPKFNIDEYLDPTTGAQTKPLPVTNDADYDALPSGTHFIDPEGNERVKP